MIFCIDCLNNLIGINIYEIIYITFNYRNNFTRSKTLYRITYMNRMLLLFHILYIGRQHLCFSMVIVVSQYALYTRKTKQAFGTRPTYATRPSGIYFIRVRVQNGVKNTNRSSYNVIWLNNISVSIMLKLCVCVCGNIIYHWYNIFNIREVFFG